MSLERRNVIFHIDVNSAFLSWEAVYRLGSLTLVFLFIFKKPFV